MSKKKRKSSSKKFSIRTPSSHLSRMRSENSTDGKKKRRRKKKKKGPKVTVDATQRGLTPQKLADAYGGGRRVKPVQKKVHNAVISIAAGDFVPNQIFERGDTVARQFTLYCDQPNILDFEGEDIHLSIGMDVGTSCTKVVIGDIDSDRFYAVPFSDEVENRFLLPTEIKQAGTCFYPVTWTKAADVHKNLKLDLIDSPKSIEFRIRMIAYIAYVLRHSINWFLREHEDYIGGRSMLWTLNIGIPAGKGEQSTLSRLFRTLSTAAGQATISDHDYFEETHLKHWLNDTLRDSNRVSRGQDSEFSFLAIDDTVVEAIPEVAAQMYGIKKSHKWSERNPITFLMDVGAGTVDAGVFSIMPSSDRADHDLAFNLFSTNVSSTGVKRLHVSRVRWLRESLPASMPFRDRILAYLKVVESVTIAGIGIPKSISDYINTLNIPAKVKSPDSLFKKQMHDEIYRKVLHRAKAENPNDKTWEKLRTIVSGGGSASEYYKDFVNSMSSLTLRLSVVQMDLPKNLTAPGLRSNDYHRLSVAYGLAHYDRWKFRWPQDFKPILRMKSANSVRGISKDDV